VDNGTPEIAARQTQDCPNNNTLQTRVSNKTDNAPEDQSVVNSCPTVSDSSHTNNSIPIPVHISRKPNSELNKANDSNQKRDVFLGVTHRKRRTAKFYLTGIDCETSRDGIFNYVQESNIRVTYLSLFQSKYNKDCLSAKIHVPEENRTALCARSFWPPGVKCRPWISVYERKQNRENNYKYNHDNEEY
jgi:hypothetical protein